MNPVDPRTRSKVILDASNASAQSVALPQVALTNFLFVLALGSAQDFLIFSDANVSWIVVRVLACGALAVIVWWLITGRSSASRSIEWPTVAFASLLQVLRVVSLMLALVHLPYPRVAVITLSSFLWMNCLLRPQSRLHVISILFGFVFSVLSSAGFSYGKLWNVIPAYAALALEALSSSILEHTQGILIPTLGGTFAAGITIVGGFVLHGTLYLLSKLFLGGDSVTPSGVAPLVIISLLAFSILYVSPSLSRKMATSSSQDTTLSYVTVLAFSSLLAVLAFSQQVTAADLFVAVCFCYGMRPGQHYSRRESPYASISQLGRAYLKSILSNPESRKIFYFLVLNMCYMLVQMLYGIWTNSLGLISDAIHMAFDCMAIGVGLIASVMARWPPNERFTYGYGRIETLSGFSNGVFLILISIFIVFEAIERLMDPPDMNTSQLLLVSSLGLAVNLFGMFAMGGHHHGGHSHSHTHSDSHSHGHDHSHANHQRHSHDEGVCAVDSHDHGVKEATHRHLDGKNSPVSSSHTHSEHVHTHTHTPTPDHQHHQHHQHQHHSPSLSPSDRSQTEEKASLKLPSPESNAKSPITPNYRFGYDSHFEKSHADEHTPNVHNHSHVHEHAHEGHSHNMRGVFLHVMADTLGSIGVIISTLLIQYYGWTGFDPIASLFIAVLIAASVIPLVIDTGKVLMLDLSERTSHMEVALSELHHVEGLESHSSAKFWPKDDNNVIGSIHVKVAPSASSVDPGGPHSILRGHYTTVDKVVERVDTLLRSKIAGLEELSIQVEAGHGDAFML